MKVSNMKDLLKYVEEKKKQQTHDHYEMAKVFGPCKGMGNRRYKLPQKSIRKNGFIVYSSVRSYIDRLNLKP